MKDQELNRIVQYVSASTSYSREAIAEILTTGFAELMALASSSSQPFKRQVLVEYVCTWTVQRTGHTEAMVREVLACAERWLNEFYEELYRERQNSVNKSENLP